MSIKPQKDFFGESIFSKNNINIIGFIISYSVFPAIIWWFTYMKQNGSGIDYYPSLWIESIPFILLTYIGSLAGAIFITSFISTEIKKTRYIKILSIILIFGIINPTIFNKLIWYKFEMASNFNVLLELLSGINDCVSLLLILGWIISLFKFPYQIIILRKNS